MSQIKGYRWWVLGLLFMNVVMGMMAFELMSALFPEISLDIPMTKVQFGLAMGIFHFASPIFTPIGGMLVDKIGVRKVLLIAMIIVAAAGVSRIFATSYIFFVFSMFFLGVGFASIGPSITKALSSVFDHHQLGKANGVAYSAFGMGNSLAFGTGATLLSPLFGGWRPTFIAVAAVCLLLGVIWFLIYRDKFEAETSPEKAEEKLPFFDTMKTVSKIRDMRLLGVFLFFSLFSYWALLSHITPTLGERGIENPGLYTATLTAASVIFNIVGGVISDWIGKRKPVLAVCVVLLACAIPGMLFFTGTALLIVMLIAGAALGPVLPLSASIPVELKGIGRPLAGTAVGFMFMVGNLGAVSGPIVVGGLMDSSSTLWAPYILPVLMLVFSLVPLTMLREGGSEFDLEENTEETV